MYTVVCRLCFAAAHRVAGHEGQCRFLHGHNYLLFVYVEAEALDPVGRVIDFSDIKTRLGGWIDSNWDHTTIIWEKDIELLDAIAPFCRGGKPFLLPYNPTAENLARYVLEVVCPQQFEGTGITVTRVRIWETENCSAENKL